MKKIEICCGDLASVEVAACAGADRVELCSGLAEGGVTPSAGFVEEAMQYPQVGVNVLVRPRGGDFLYDKAEVRLMCRDIAHLVRLGVNGIVVGALTADGEVNKALCRQFLDAAAGVSTTFHRAFDLCNDPFRALETIVELGFDRILTSGLAPSAFAGVSMLSKLLHAAAGRVIILAGCGINPNNVEYILRHSGVSEVHASARGPLASAMTFRRNNVAMGNADADEYSRMTARRETIEELVRIVHK